MRDKQKRETEERGKKHHVCTECACKFSREADLKRHLHDHDTLHKCNMCNKTFGSQKSLKRHNQTAHEEQHHICEVCGKSFGQPDRLKEQSISHKHKPFKCDTCDCSFSTKFKSSYEQQSCSINPDILHTFVSFPTQRFLFVTLERLFTFLELLLLVE